MRSFLWFALLLVIPRVLCVLNNITVDDSNPSIRYSPLGAWNALDSAQNCSGCTAQPDASNMLFGTWHDGTFNPTSGSNNYPNTPLFANFTFNGSAVYVFCALAESTTHPDGNSDMAFYIDGQLVNSFVRPAPGINAYDYQFPVFSVSSLEPREHTLVLQNGYVNASKSLVLLDYIVYSLDDESSIKPSLSLTSISTPFPSTSNGQSTGVSRHDTPTIIGVAVTIPIVILLLALSIISLRKQRRLRLAIRQSPLSSWKRDTVVPVPLPALSSWMIEPLSLPPSHPASGYVNGSGRQVAGSVPSAPTASSQQGSTEMPSRSHRPAVPSSASTSSYGRIIYVHNLEAS